MPEAKLGAPIFMLHQPGSDYVDRAGDVWLHDPKHGSREWACVAAHVNLTSTREHVEARRADLLPGNGRDLAGSSWGPFRPITWPWQQTTPSANTSRYTPPIVKPYDGQDFEEMKARAERAEHATDLANRHFESFKRQVAEKALEIKDEERWCDDGFRTAMESLGLLSYVERPYDVTFTVRVRVNAFNEDTAEDLADDELRGALDDYHTYDVEHYDTRDGER